MTHFLITCEGPLLTDSLSHMDVTGVMHRFGWQHQPFIFESTGLSGLLWLQTPWSPSWLYVSMSLCHLQCSPTWQHWQFRNIYICRHSCFWDCIRLDCFQSCSQHKVMINSSNRKEDVWRPQSQGKGEVMETSSALLVFNNDIFLQNKKHLYHWSGKGGA